MGRQGMTWPSDICQQALDANLSMIATNSPGEKLLIRSCHLAFAMALPNFGQIHWAAAMVNGARISSDPVNANSPLD
jgi:hypothetical protein